MNATFTSPLETLLIKPDITDDVWNGRDWVLASPLTWSCASCILHTVPVGFSTDGASIPRFARWMFNPLGGRAFRAAIVHDWIYRGNSSAGYTRKEADDILLHLMLFDNMPKRKSSMIFRAVRMGGRSSFRA